MIKCHIDRKKGVVFTRAKGEGYDISLETMALIGEVYRGIVKKNPEAGAAFRTTIIAGVLDPKSPVWKNTPSEK